LLMLQLRHGIAPITSGNRSAFDERVRPDRPARVGEETPVTTTPHHVLWPARAAR
jgi:hypothetical protein